VAGISSSDELLSDEWDDSLPKCNDPKICPISRD